MIDLPGFRRVLADVLASRDGWLLGTAGFLARGGLLLYAIPFWVLPSPVGISLLIPPVSITSSGISPELQHFIAVAVTSVLLAMVALLVVSAWCDLAIYERLMGGSSPTAPRRRLVMALVAMEIVALIPATVAAWLTVGRLLEVGRQEYLLPSSLAVPYVVRLVTDARDQVFVLLTCILLAELIYTAGSRRILRSAWCPSGATSTLDRVLASSARAASGTNPALRTMATTVVTWVATWIATLVCVVPGLGLSLLAWNVVRASVDAGSIAAGPLALLLPVAAVALFVACWSAAILLAGAGSAARAVLWSAATAGRNGA